MHYYQFNIGDYASHTAHLDPLEDIAYRRMLDWVYLHESPLPLSVKQISKYIRMRDECERIADVLQQFFTETEYGYAQRKADIEITKYRDKSEKAKKAAEARWSAKPDKPHADALQTQCERNANHKPRTINQEPVNKVKEKDAKATVFNFKSEVLLLGVSSTTVDDWLMVRKQKNSANTQTAFISLTNEIQKSGLLPQQAVEMAAANSWARFDSSWVNNNNKNNIPHELDFDSKGYSQ